eukprot:scaffold28019_cov132-Isochrysis_galbana.AAC.6
MVDGRDRDVALGRGPSCSTQHSLYTSSSRNPASCSSPPRGPCNFTSLPCAPVCLCHLGPAHDSTKPSVPQTKTTLLPPSLPGSGSTSRAMAWDPRPVTPGQSEETGEPVSEYVTLRRPPGQSAAR